MSEQQTDHTHQFELKRDYFVILFGVGLGAHLAVWFTDELIMWSIGWVAIIVAVISYIFLKEGWIGNGG